MAATFEPPIEYILSPNSIEFVALHVDVTPEHVRASGFDRPAVSMRDSE